MKQWEQTRGAPLVAGRRHVCNRLDLLVLARCAYGVITASDQWSRSVLEIGRSLAISGLVPWPDSNQRTVAIT